MQNELEYVGFWPRVGAAIIDGILFMLLTLPPLMAIYGTAYWSADASLVQGPADFLISWVFPAVATIAFWVWKRATPGKMIIGAEVVDSVTGDTIGIGRGLVRYIGYFVSMIVLLLGYVWVAFDPRKQGWHDKLAGTVVIRKRRDPEPVRFS